MAFQNILNQIPTPVEADILGSLIEKFLDSSVDLASNAILDADGKERLPALDNHSMGTIFEELIRRFNEENNEEDGHFGIPASAMHFIRPLS